MDALIIIGLLLCVMTLFYVISLDAKDRIIRRVRLERDTVESLMITYKNCPR